MSARRVIMLGMIPSPVSERSIVLTREDHVAWIVLNRPDRHNALEAEDIELFRSSLETVAADDQVRALVVTGSGGRTFCAGASLRQIHTGDMSGEIFDTLTAQLASLRVPTICALNGGVYGGGAEIALCCDFRIGVTHTRLSVPAARLGICYPLGGLRRYVSRLGLGVAQRILVAAEELDAQEMQRVGFLHRVVPPDDLGPVTTLMAARIAALAPLAVQAMKRSLTDIADGTLDVEAATAAIARCMESEDLREGLRAQREGDEPRFEGR
jgi:enoyl-CoA hydratase/carnithine racemase